MPASNQQTSAESIPTTDPPTTNNEWIRDCITIGRQHTWREIAPWHHNAVNICFLAVEFAIIATTSVWVAQQPIAIGVPVGAIILGGAFFLLLAIGVHEASHGMFFVSAQRIRRRRLNHILGWILSIPFGVHYEKHWEVGHITHHARPLEPDDPQRFNTDTGRPLARTAILMLLVPGYALVHRYISGRVRAPGRTSPAVLIMFLAIWIGLIVSFTMAGLGRVALAYVFGLQVMSAINQIKGALEHGGDVGIADDRRLRSRTLTTRIGAMLWPFHVTVFHFEHHLVDQVPWYRLHAFHRALGDRVPAAQRNSLFRSDPLRVLAKRVERAS